MAPKGGGGGGKGGGGGGRGGSASCPECIAPMELLGSDWRSKIGTALFAIEIIVAIVLLACIILQTRFKWIRDNLALDKLRNKGYYYATGSMLIFYILYIIDHALHEESTVVTRLYYLLYIIAELFVRIADVLILAIIYRTIAESSLSNLARKLRMLHKLIIFVLALSSLIVFALFTTIEVYQMKADYYGGTTYQAWEYVTVAYQAIYVLAALLAGLESLTVFLRARSKPTLLMLTITIPFLILHALFSLILIATAMYYNRNYKTAISFTNLRTACLFVIDISNAFIFLGVVLVGWVAHKRGGKGTSYASTGVGGGETQYSPVGGWGR